MGVLFLSRVQFADKTIGEILIKDDRFNRFLSLVDVSIPLRLIKSDRCLVSASS